MFPIALFYVPANLVSGGREYFRRWKQKLPPPLRGWPQPHRVWIPQNLRRPASMSRPVQGNRRQRIQPLFCMMINGSLSKYVMRRLILGKDLSSPGTALPEEDVQPFKEASTPSTILHFDWARISQNFSCSSITSFSVHPFMVITSRRNTSRVNSSASA